MVHETTYSRTNRRSAVERWTKPPTGWTKANADGAMDKQGRSGGGGAVVRDQHGKFLAGACHFFPSIDAPEMAELLACRRAVQLTMEIGKNKLMLETDCQSVVTALVSQERDRSTNGLLVEEIKMMLKSMDQYQVRWARRTANSAAHILAREGCLNKNCKTWLHVEPACIADVINSEASEN